MSIALDLLDEELSLARLEPDAPVPAWAENSVFSCIARTPSELSIVTTTRAAAAAGEGTRVDAGWRALRVRGPLPFDLVGIVAAVATPLAAAGIPIFPVATFDTDYVLLKGVDLARGIEALRAAGLEVHASPTDNPRR